jgi:phosphoglycerate dehydrogenase-like enzyme
MRSTVRIVSLLKHWDAELTPLLDPGLELVGVDPKDEDAVLRALPDADILIAIRFTAAMGSASKRLRLLICPAAGTDEIDRSALPQGVQLVRGSGHEIPMAEYVLGTLVALRVYLLEADATLRRADWRYGFLGAAGPHEEVYGSALGLIGFGGIGSAIVQRASSFGMRCAAVTLHPQKPKDEASRLEFLGRLANAQDVDRLVAWCDALVVCCQLSELTRGILDARRFSLMKRTAVVINVARGPVVQEKDFYDALTGGRIAGAAIDVWYRYPPKDSHPSEFPFWDLRNVIMTPHYSAWTKPAMQRRLAAMALAINRFARAYERA